MLEHLRLLSRYNQWMNDKLYNTAAQLPADELAVATEAGCRRDRFGDANTVGVDPLKA